MEWCYEYPFNNSNNDTKPFAACASKGDGDGLADGAVAGIVIGGCFGILLLLMVVVGGLWWISGIIRSQHRDYAELPDDRVGSGVVNEDLRAKTFK